MTSGVPPNRARAGLPDSTEWIQKELLCNAPSQCLVAVLESAVGPWSEFRAYVRGLDEPKYRRIDPLKDGCDFRRVFVAPDRPKAYVNVFRRSEETRGYHWEGLYGISLPEGTLTPLDPPPGFPGVAGRRRWVSEIIGVLPACVLQLKIGIERAATPQELAETSSSAGTTLSSGVVADYFIAEYELGSGVLREIGPLLSPLY